jgi:alkyl hydroperoxide reductase subunit AhpC
VICSYPKAFHPVGTTELGSLCEKFDELEALGCKVVGLSVDTVLNHKEWLKDVAACHTKSSVLVKFPIISDCSRSISEVYGMLDPFTMGLEAMPLTVRSVFVISPENLLLMRLEYPSSVGVSVPLRSHEKIPANTYSTVPSRSS